MYVNVEILSKLCRCIHYDVYITYLDGCVWMTDLSHILLHVKYVSRGISEDRYIFTIILTSLQIYLHLRQ